MQHTKFLQFYSTWESTTSLTEQITGFYSIHISQLWYWDNTTRIFLTSTSEPKKFRLTQVRRPSQMALLIEAKDSSSVNNSSSFTKAKWIQKNSSRQQNKDSITTGAKTCQQFLTKAMRSSQAFIHARMRSCSTHHLRVWEHVQVKESQQLLFQKSPQVFQGGAHTLCKIDESNNNVGRATVFDTKKRCDE